MEITPRRARGPARALFLVAGLVLVALGAFFTVWERAPIPAAVAGAAGLCALRRAYAERSCSPLLIALDAAAFALLAYQRNDALGFWQLPGPWADVFRVNFAGSIIALTFYLSGSVYALVAAARGLRLIEGVGLIATPYLFNFLVLLSADWHMAEIGAFVTAHAPLPFQAQAAIGRAIVLFFLGEALLLIVCLVAVDQLPIRARSHFVVALAAVFAALTPHIADAATWVTNPLLAIVFSAACAALAQGGLWAIVYLMTGLVLDWLGGRPPRFDALWGHWRTGLIKGAIYGALFMGFVLITAFVLRLPGAEATLSRFRACLRPAAGRAALSARRNRRRERRWHAAFLRPSRRGLSQSSLVRSRARGGTGARARL